MDKQTEEIKKGLEQLALRFGPAAIQPATVKSIDADDTITVELSSDLEIEGVRLRSVVKSGDKVVIEPKVGSVVQIAAIDNSKEFIVVAVEEIEKITIQKGTLLIVVDDKLEVKKGSDSLSKIITDMILEINKIVVLVGTSPNVAALTAIDVRQKLFLK